MQETSRNDFQPKWPDQPAESLPPGGSLDDDEKHDDDHHGRNNDDVDDHDHESLPPGIYLDGKHDNFHNEGNE